MNGRAHCRSLPAGARWSRGVWLAALVAGLTAGTLWGEDEHFPFAPMRMYAHTTSGSVKELKLVGVTVTGREIPVRFAQTRMRRAEVAGQVPLFQEDPQRMRHLARAYHDSQRESEPLAELGVVYLVYPLSERGTPLTPRELEVATWRRA